MSKSPKSDSDILGNPETRKFIDEILCFEGEEVSLSSLVARFSCENAARTMPPDHADAFLAPSPSEYAH